MTVLLYANNAKTTLAAPINATQTTITVAPGTGVQFPSPTTGQAFKLTLVSASSSSTLEICICTARTGDTLTVVRAQEGTSGTPFLLNDIVGNYDTAGTMVDLVQSEQLQNQYYQYAVATGSANALTASLPSNLTVVNDGFFLNLKSASANTGAVTLNLTLGSTATGVMPVVKGNNQPLIAGDIPGAGYPLSLTYSSTFGAWVLTDASVVLTPYALINSQTFTGTPRVPTAPFNDNSTIIANTNWVENQLANYAPIYSPTFTGTPGVPNAPFNDNSTIIASTSWVQGQLANYAPIYNPTLTGTPSAPTAPVGTNTTQLATTAFVQNQISTQIKGLGFGGTTWHSVSRSIGTSYSNPYSYPIAVSASVYGSAYAGMQWYVNGILLGQNEAGTNGPAAYNACFFIVPPGATYQINGGGLNSWAELY